MFVSLEHILKSLAIGVLFFASMPSWAQINPYVYVQMSMAVPWFLYFVFLACILIPFFVMIIVAWRRYFSSTKHNSKR